MKPECSVADQCTGDCDGQTALSAPSMSSMVNRLETRSGKHVRTADYLNRIDCFACRRRGRVPLIGDEGTVASSRTRDSLRVHRRSEVVDVLGERQLGDTELIANGACLLLGVSDDARRFVLPIDAVAVTSS